MSTKEEIRKAIRDSKVLYLSLARATISSRTSTDSLDKP